jgi:Asp-tRNA(Asn)/Glu-tRNA(Gln) amidotransferase A subunit family amidase
MKIDLYHIAGVSTGAGSRAYAKAYGDQVETADSIKVLIEMGGILVGKAKTAQ